MFGKCSGCGELKEFSAFYARRDRPLGRMSECRVCTVARNAIYGKKFRSSNPELVRFYGRQWSINNKSKVAAKASRRRAAKLKASPVWANSFFIEEAYDLAQKRTKATGFEWQVDHIVPLRSNTVCGLHTHGNLQVIPASINTAKGNRYWPDMPRD